MNFNVYTIKVRPLLLAIIIIAGNTFAPLWTDGFRDGGMSLFSSCVYFSAKWEEAAVSPFYLRGEISSPRTVVHSSCTAAFGSM